MDFRRHMQAGFSSFFRAPAKGWLGMERGTKNDNGRGVPGHQTRRNVTRRRGRPQPSTKGSIPLARMKKRQIA